MEYVKGFASDNWAGVHEEVLAAISTANQGHQRAYGDDAYTEAAKERFKECFGDGIEVYFTFNGTAANVMSACAVCQPHHAVLCAETSHFHYDECGATERFNGSRVLTVPAHNGKMTSADIEPMLTGIGDAHRSQPRLISITQASELGTVYSAGEVREMADFAHKHDVYLHMDGARLANAAAGLGLGLRQITRDVGVDLLSFGGTKNGLLLGEAVVFMDAGLADEFAYTHKQGLQLASKMRFISAQFLALLTDELWLRCARQANDMAQRLAQRVGAIEGVEVTRPVQANAVFARLPAEHISPLQEQYPFHVWDEATSEVRWMSAFDTTEEDVDGFADAIEAAMKGKLRP